MFDWISGKKDAGQFRLSDKARERLQHITQNLNQAQDKEESELSPEAVLEQLLHGVLSLVSQTAKGQIFLAPNEVTYQPLDAVPPQDVSSDSGNEAVNASAENATQSLSQGPTALTEQATAPPEPPLENSHPQQIESLQKQVEMLQTRLNQRRDQQAAQQAKIATLLRKTQQQEQDIETLKTQAEQLRQAAAIGEAQLNRWRFNNFSR
jgi:hypothetical protein